MIQLTLHPIFHLFNSILPPLAAFMVASAFLTSFSGTAAKRQPKPAIANAPKLKRIPYQGKKLNQVTPNRAKAYTMPTSMRSRPSLFS
jgi:hypothetical protein